MTDYDEDQDSMDICRNIRHPDLPRFKEHFMSQINGKIIGFLESQGLQRGKEYETKTQELLSCSKSIIWIWDNDKNRKHQLVIVINSIDMSVDYGVAFKPKNLTIYRKSLKDLRYNISSGSDMSLTEGSKIKWKEFFEGIQSTFHLLKDKDEWGA